MFPEYYIKQFLSDITKQSQKAEAASGAWRLEVDSFDSRIDNHTNFYNLCYIFFNNDRIYAV